MGRESTRIATIIFSVRNMIDVLRCCNQPRVYLQLCIHYKFEVYQILDCESGLNKTVSESRRFTKD